MVRPLPYPHRLLHRCLQLCRPRMLVVAGLGCLAVGAIAWLVIPFPAREVRTTPAALHIEDREGGLLRVALPPGGHYADPIPIGRTSDWAGPAIIAAEDKRFYSHHGMDVLALLRAMAQNVFGLRVISGASTLSTQVIRMSVPRERTLPTKISEAVGAFKLERSYDKDAILAEYLDRAPMGGNIYGVQAAARAYFGCDASELSLGQAALLMGLPQSPTRFRPDRHLAKALVRRSYVLRRMELNGAITSTQRLAAEEERWPVQRRDIPFLAPHFCDLFLQRYGSVHDGRDGQSHHVRSSLDPDMQLVVEQLVASQRSRLQTRGLDSAAVVVVDVATGRVRAMVGSFDYNEPTMGQVNGATALRAAGSTLKPFAYALAFDRGLLAPGNTQDDSPRRFRDYSPDNFSGQFQGSVTVREALVRSLNIPALDTVQLVGLDTFHATLRQLGLTSLDQPASFYGLSLALGTAEVRLLDLCGAYACIARGGLMRPISLREDEPLTETTRLFSEGAAYLISDVLGGDERNLAVLGHNGETDVPRIAWKTGTSSGYRDAWTVAWNPEYVVGVWVGARSRQSSGEAVGMAAAAPLAVSIFRQIYRGRTAPWFDRPADVYEYTLCLDSGKRAGPACTRTAHELGLVGVGRPAVCSGHTHSPPPLRIASPRDGTQISLGAPTAPDELLLSAVTPHPDDSVRWFANGQNLGSSSGKPFAWRAPPGTHQLVCMLPDGTHDSVQVTIRR